MLLKNKLVRNQCLIPCFLTFFLLGLTFNHTSALASVKILGQLGQAISKTSIHAHPDSKSRTYYQLKPYEYIIVKSFKKTQWLIVSMQRGIYGYVRAEKIAVLPYQVNSNQTQNPSLRIPLGGGRGSWIASSSLKYIGIPYRFGGNDLRGGIDCSAFVQKLYGQIGVSLPRTAAEQALVGHTISRLEHLQTGDRLYFWEHKRKKIGHTGIYLGNGFFVHASSNRKGVATDDLRNPKWQKLLVAAKR